MGTPKIVGSVIILRSLSVKSEEKTKILLFSNCAIVLQQEIPIDEYTIAGFALEELKGGQLSKHKDDATACSRSPVYTRSQIQPQVSEPTEAKN